MAFEPLHNPRRPAPTNWEEMENLINNKFREIITKVKEKRDTVLAEIRDLRRKELYLIESIREVERMKYTLEEQMGNNLVIDLQRKTIVEFNEKLSSLRKEQVENTDYMFVFNGKEIERSLSTLGSIQLRPKHYLGKGVPKLTFGNLPENPIKKPVRVSCEEELGLIALTDVPTRQIFLFSLNGDFIQSFGRGYFKFPCAVKIISHKELAVSDFEHQNICKVVYDRDKRTKPKISPVYTQAKTITSLDYDKASDLIYASSSSGHCVLILTREYKFVSSIRGFLLFPQSIFVAEKEIYVLDKNNPALHILCKLSHEKIRSIIPCGIGLELENSAVFTLDQDGYIIIGKCQGPDKMLQVYSQSGQLLHSFSKEGNAEGDVLDPAGIFVTKNRDLLVLSRNSNFPIQLF